MQPPARRATQSGMNEAESFATIDLDGGDLRVQGWPEPTPPPFGLQARGGSLRGPARLRAAAARALRAAGVPFVDRLDAPPIATPPGPALSRTEASLLHAWQLAVGHGLASGIPLSSRVHLACAAVANVRQPLLVITVDSGAEHVWRRALEANGLQQAAGVITVATAARAMHWLARRHDLLVVDSPELMPARALDVVLDGSPARWRFGFVGRPDARSLLRWAGSLGPLIGIVDSSRPPRCIELRVPLPDTEAAAHTAAWHTFLAAFDRFAALQPSAGFGTFVQQARGDPAQRPALSAWHEALRAASWHAHKAAVIAELLHRHRGERILVFTPDRASAYALSRQHLIAPVTAELPRAERQHAVDDFVAGSQRVLAGPRLLDLGVPDGIADVGILVGGGYGRDQRSARCLRVSPLGLVYELVSLGTVEVGRAQRWRGTPAGATAVVPGDRW